MTINQHKWPEGEHPVGLTPSTRASYRIVPVESMLHTSIPDKDPFASKLGDPTRSKLITVEFQWTREQFVVFENFYRLTLKNGSFPFRMPVWEERGEFIYTCFFAGSYTQTPSGFGWRVKITVEADTTYPVLSKAAEDSFARFGGPLQSLTVLEINVLSEFIDSLVAEGLWANIHEYWAFLYRDKEACLIGLKTGKFMILDTDNIGLTHDPDTGFRYLSGGHSLVSDWNVIDDGGSDYDLLVGAYIASNDEIGGLDVHAFGVLDTVGGGFRLTLGQGALFVEGFTGTDSNLITPPTGVVTAESDFQNGKFYSLSRIGGTQFVHSDGVLLGSAIENNLGALHNLPLGLFGSLETWNPTAKTGTFGNRWKGTISSYLIAKPILDVPRFVEIEDTLRQKLSGHAEETTRVLLRLGANLQPFETSAIVKFVNSQVAIGNWQKVREFYCFALSTPGVATIGFISHKALQSQGPNPQEGLNPVHVPAEGFHAVLKPFEEKGGYIDTQFFPSLLPSRIAQHYGCYVSVARPPFLSSLNQQGTEGFLFGVSNSPHYFNTLKRDAVAIYLNTQVGGYVPVGLGGSAWSDIKDASVNITETVYEANTQYSVRRDNTPLGDTVLYKGNAVQWFSTQPSNVPEVDKSIFCLAYHTHAPGDDANFPVAREFTSCSLAAWWVLEDVGAFSRVLWKTAVDVLMQDLGVPGA